MVFLSSFPVSTPQLFFMCKKKSWGVETGNEARSSYFRLLASVVYAHFHLYLSSPQLKENAVGAYEALRKGVFIIASTLIIFVALRNSLIW